MNNHPINDEHDEDLLATLRRQQEAEEAKRAARERAALGRIPRQGGRRPGGPGRDPKTDAFLDFHNRNPSVYRLIVRFAREAQAAGFEKYGIGDILGRVRWETNVVDREAVETGGQDFKINDHTQPYYARLIMAREADLRGMFDVRTSAADTDIWMGDAA